MNQILLLLGLSGVFYAFILTITYIVPERIFFMRNALFAKFWTYTLFALGCGVNIFWLFAAYHPPNQRFHSVPFFQAFNLPFHPFIVSIVYGICLSFILLLLIHGIALPLYLKKSHRWLKTSVIAQINAANSNGFLNLQQYFKRSIILCLFIFGIGGSLFRWGVFDPSWFLPEGTMMKYVEEGINPEYTKEVAFFLAIIIAPIALALFSIGWGLEDLRLIRVYVNPEHHNTKPFIEPLNRAIIDFLKGYAGLAAIFYYASLVVYGYRTNAVNDFLAIMALLIVMVVQLYPIYWIYWGLIKHFSPKILGGVKIYNPEKIEEVMARLVN